MSEASIEQQALESVRERGLLEHTGPLVVMLSGGRDSVCLLDLATRLRGPSRVLALHVNYGLRPEAAREQEHCETLCRGLGVTLEIRRSGAPGPGNLQAWARELRYREAGLLAREGGGLVAAGHTATDQLETILYRLAASPGRRALLGMSAREGLLVRPLLALTRAQTAAYCTARGLHWCEDASNASERYARGRVRAHLLPALLAIHPAAEANVLRTAALLREETDLLEGLVDAELEGRAGIAVERLVRMHPALARLVLVRLAEQAAGQLVPQAGERLAELLALAGRPTVVELHLGGNVAAVIEADTLRMVKLAPRQSRALVGDPGELVRGGPAGE